MMKSSKKIMIIDFLIKSLHRYITIMKVNIKRVIIMFKDVLSLKLGLLLITSSR